MSRSKFHRLESLGLCVFVLRIDTLDWKSSLQINYCDLLDFEVQREKKASEFLLCQILGYAGS